MSSAPTPTSPWVIELIPYQYQTGTAIVPSYEKCLRWEIVELSKQTLMKGTERAEKRENYTSPPGPPRKVEWASDQPKL